jgi:lipopolysaccharide export system permease protein
MQSEHAYDFIGIPNKPEPMKIIRQYFTLELLKSCLLALFVLVALFSFFTLIDQLEDTRGNYGATQAVVYTLLIMPRLAYELFPIAAVIGSMALLGIMMRNHELEVLLTSGVSRLKLVMIMIRSSLLVVIIAVITGEIVAPVSEERAQNLRSLALSENITLKSRYGLWIRDGNSYVNIRRVLPGNRIEDIYVYEFDRDHNLLSSFHAGNAVYTEGQWLMEDINQSLLGEDAVQSRTVTQDKWRSLLNPEIINVVTVKPQYLSVLGLVNYIRYLKQNAQNAQLYEQALWVKLVKPFSIMAMIALAVPLISGKTRTLAVGQRVFIGALAGIIFHIITQISENLGVVYQIPPLISVTTPTLLLIGLILYLLRTPRPVSRPARE